MMPSSRCARRAVKVLPIRRPKPRLIFPVRNRGAKKGPAAPGPVTSLRLSGAAVAWFSDRSLAITPRKFPSRCGVSHFQKALSERINAGDVLTVDEFAVTELKTKSFLSLLGKQTDARRCSSFRTRLMKIPTARRAM